MGSYIKLIGSIIIGSLLLLSIHRYASSLSENSNERTIEFINTIHASEISKLIEYDFNRLGLGVGVSNINSVISHADSTHIAFLADLDANGTVDSVEYILSDSTAALGTENPYDKILYRNVNIENQGIIEAGVTQFKINYLDWQGNETNVLSDIRTFEINLICEGRFSYKNNYSRFLWHTRISPPNLLRY